MKRRSINIELPLSNNKNSGTWVKISAKCMRMLFTGCEKSHIKNTCHGVCCRNSNNKLSVTIANNEISYIESKGCKVLQNLLQPSLGKTWCPFQNENNHLCLLHNGHQPKGCAISPFTINDNNTVIVRHRYVMMNCHKKGTKEAYIVFSKSLEMMFGKKTAYKIKQHLDNGGFDIHVKMRANIFNMMKKFKFVRKERKNADRKNRISKRA